MSKTAFTLGKFYPFHEGHKGLLNFMDNYPIQFFDDYIALVCGKTTDLIPTWVRHSAVYQYTKELKNDFHIGYLNNDSMPDYPEEDENFWEKWVHEVESRLRRGTDEITLFTSEMYGEQFAKEIENRIPYIKKCNHVPFNSDRNMIDVSGTTIRNDFLNSICLVDKTIIDYLSKSIYLMGAESTGKTTFARNTVENHFNYSFFIPEYARDYLTIKGPELNEEKFNDIILGQWAQEKMVEKVNLPFNFFDTNLLTTYGWAKLYYPEIAEEMKRKFDFNKMYRKRNSIVILMNDDIPFEKDPLRYGVDKRHTNTKYWEDILNEFKIPYIHKENIKTEEIFDVFNEKGLYNGI